MADGGGLRPLAVVLLVVAALVGGGLVVYLLLLEDGAGPQLSIEAPTPVPLEPSRVPEPPRAPATATDPESEASQAITPSQADPTPVEYVLAPVTPEIAESDVHPQVQQQGLALVEAVVEQYEAAWPWVRRAWERSDVRFYDRRLPAPCDRAGIVGCVLGNQLLLTLRGVQTEEAVLHELGHVWNNTAGEDWRLVQDAFAEHYAGCYSRRAPTPERLQEELLVDAMVIATGAALDNSLIDGLGYYEGDLWADGFDGCLADSSKPAPHLLDAIWVALFDCSLDVEAAVAEARAQAMEESGSGLLPFRTGAEFRTAEWAARAPQACAHTTVAHQRTVELLAHIVGQYEVPWPWVRDAWNHSNIEFVDELPTACGAAAVFDLNLAVDVFDLDASRNPPPGFCVRETRILASYAAAAADRDALVEPFLQALARVWDRTADDERWAAIQVAFARHLAGCRSHRAATPEAIHEGVIADTMVSTAGGLIQSFGWYGYSDQRWSFEDCAAEPVRTRLGGGSVLATAVEAALFQCPYSAALAEAAWTGSGADTSGWFAADRGWRETARDICDDNT